MGWGRRWEGGSGWGTHVNPWLIHVNVWQKPLQYSKVISLQLIKINEKKKHESEVTGQGLVFKILINALNSQIKRQTTKKGKTCEGTLAN